MDRVGESEVASRQLMGLLSDPNQKVREAAACVLFFEVPCLGTFGICYDKLKERIRPSDKDEQALLNAADQQDWLKVKQLFKSGACGYSFSGPLEAEASPLPSPMSLPLGSDEESSYN